MGRKKYRYINSLLLILVGISIIHFAFLSIPKEPKFPIFQFIFMLIGLLITLGGCVNIIYLIISSWTKK